MAQSNMVQNNTDIGILHSGSTAKTRGILESTVCRILMFLLSFGFRFTDLSVCQVESIVT